MSYSQLTLPFNGDRLVIDKTQHVLFTKENGRGSILPFARDYMLEKVSKPDGGTGNVLLPPGTRYLQHNGDLLTILYEFAPRVWNFNCSINQDSLGRLVVRTNRRYWKISLPHVLLTICVCRYNDRYVYLPMTQCVFLTSPMRSLQDKTYFAPLFNTAPPELYGGHGKNWLCTGDIKESEICELFGFNDFESAQRKIEVILPAYIKYIAQGFTSKSFNGDISVDSTIYARVAPKIPGIYGMDKWEKNSLKDPNFWQKVSWVERRMTVKEVMDSATESCLQNVSCLRTQHMNDYDRIRQYIENRGRNLKRGY